MDKEKPAPASDTEREDAPQEKNEGGSEPDAAEQEAAASPLQSYMRVLKYNDGKGQLMHLVSLICLVGSGTLLPLMDIVFGKFVSVFNKFVQGISTPDEFRKEVDHFTLYFVYLWLAKFVFTYIWSVFLALTAIRTTKSLRASFLDQTLRQEVAFFDHPSRSSLAGQISTNPQIINQGLGEKAGLIIQGVSCFFAAFVVAFVTHWKLTLIVISIVPVNLIVTMWCVAVESRYEAMVMKEIGRAVGLAEEAFGSVRTVHAFWAMSRLGEKVGGYLDAAHAWGRKKSPLYSTFFCLEFFCIFSAYALAFWQGVRLYQQGDIEEPGKVVTVVFVIIVAAQALTQVAPQIIHLAKASVAAQELFSTLDRQSQIDPLSPDGRRLEDFQGRIEVKDVHFEYPMRPGVPVLSGLSLLIETDKTTALVGSSGSGKSTVVGLIERWYDAKEGQITIDGVDVKDVNLQWLRTSIRLVQQNPVLFSGTVFENVANGLTGTPMAQLPEEDKRELVKEACRSAYADEFVQKLPQGYDTEIGERGATLSGGQKQRIAIARSIISNPRVLILDEATSALDPKAERIVQAALGNVSKGRSMLVIAHRLSTIKDADCIVVMEKGRQVEKGTHGDLIAAGGLYANLVAAQNLESKSRGQGEDVDDGEALAAARSKASHHESVAEVGASGGDLEKASLGGRSKYGLFRSMGIIIGEKRGLWPAFGIALTTCILAGLTYPAIAILFSRVIDVFTLVGQDDELVRRGDFWSLMLFVVALGNLFLWGLMGWFSNVIGQTIQRDYRFRMFTEILRQPMVFFDNPENTTGALAERLSSGPTNLLELLSINVLIILVNVVSLVASSILAIVTGWKLGCVLVFGALVPLVFFGYLRIRLETQMDEESSVRWQKSTGIAAEAVAAIRTIASLAMEGEVARRFEEEGRGLVGSRAVRGIAVKMVWYSLSQSFSFLAMALGFWYGGRLISWGEYENTQFYVVFIAIMMSGESAAMLFQYSSSITKAKNAANDVLQLRESADMTEDDDDDDTDGSSSGNHDKGAPSLELQNVEFSYPMRPDIKVIRDVSLKVEPGQFVALVGASGCGKSTIVALLEKFYLPTAGSISTPSLDGSSISRYRRAISLVQQEPTLFSTSIRDNLLVGLPASREPSDEDLDAALRQANIGDFVLSLPDGLGTLCGGQGVQLSGGQRQRIAIARALLRKPRLLLLDEATAALDGESEKVVLDALDRAARREGGARTTIAVAHRLATIKDADRIFVFREGRVVEQGTHDELLARKGLYYDMCLGQRLDRSLS